MSRFAVIDTETTWSDKVMSIGLAIADSDSFDLLDQRYYILTPYKNHGGMFPVYSRHPAGSGVLQGEGDG